MTKSNKDRLFVLAAIFIFCLVCAVMLFTNYNESKLTAEIWRKSWAKPLLDAGIKKHQIDNCMKWAFGDDYLTSDIRESAERWNKRHSDRFIMHGKPQLQDVATEYLANIVEARRLLRQLFEESYPIEIQMHEVNNEESVL